MAEYIDREALKLKVQRYLMPNVDADGTVLVNDAERYFLKLLEEALAADVVEVIRCKDCKHLIGDYCHLRQGLRFVLPEDYCSYAELKETKVND